MFDLVLVSVKTVDKVDINEALIFLMLLDELSALGHTEFGDKRLVCQFFSYKFYCDWKPEEKPMLRCSCFPARQQCW